MITYVPMPERSMAAVHLTFGGGAAAEPASRGGLAKILASWCAQNEELVDRLEGAGATLRGDADHDGAWLTAVCPAERLAEAAPLFARAADAPPPGGLEAVVSRRLAALRSERSHPLHRARDAFRALAYDSGSPYGRNPGGTEDTVRAIDATALAETHRLSYDPANADLLVAADPRWRGTCDVFARWRAEVTTPPRTIVPAPDPAWRLAAAPGSTQAMLMLGGVTVTSDLAALEVAVHALSGWSGSRLTRILREELGYTYGIYSSVVARRLPAGHAAEIQIYGSVEAAVLADAVERLLRECESLGGLRDEEIDRARDNLVARELMFTETARQIVDVTGTRMRRGYRPEELADRTRALRAVVPDEARRAGVESLSPGRLVLAVVGDPELCEPALGPQAERLNIGFTRR